MELHDDQGFFCIICGGADRDVCQCLHDPGIKTAALALIKTVQDGDGDFDHQVRIVAAQQRLYQAQAEAIKP